MTGPRAGFYGRVLERLLADGLLRRDMTVLVVAGGSADGDALRSLGFERVTISNLDERSERSLLEPYPWLREDAENLSLADESVDVAIVSAGLHHCRSPHRALLELYRVSRVAAIAIESRDSALMRLAVRLHAVDDYELGAVAAHGLESGGVANTSTPNFIYRWTEREVEKTLASYAPHVRHRVRYFREFEVQDEFMEGVHGPRSTVRRLARPLVAGSRVCCRARRTTLRS